MTRVRPFSPILVLELVAAKRRPYAPLHPFLLSCTFADPFFTYTLTTLVYHDGCRPPSRLLFLGPFPLFYLYLLCLAGPEKILVMYINHLQLSANVYHLSVRVLEVPMRVLYLFLLFSSLAPQLGP